MTQNDTRERSAREMLRSPVVKDIIPTILLFLSGRASVLGMLPFGAAFFSACYDKSVAYLGITALIVAIMTSGQRYMLIKYLVAVLLYWIYTRVEKKESLVRDAAFCAIASALGGTVYLVYNFSGIYDILILLIEAMVAGMMFIIFRKAQSFMLNRKNRTRTAQDELISIAVSAGVFITGLSGINFPYGISLCDILSVYAVLCIALHTALTAAGSGGLCIGFLASMSSPSAVVTMGIFGISALFANLLRSFGRIGCAIGFIGGSSIALLYAGGGGALPISLLESAVGAVLFVLTPSKIHNKIDSFFSHEDKIGELSAGMNVKDYLSMRLEKAASAFKSLEECFENASAKRLKAYSKDAAALFDETAHRVCEDCVNKERCWQNDFSGTYKSIMLLLEAIESGGELTEENIPSAFSERCVRRELFVMEFNHVYEMYKKNLVRMGEAVRSRDIVARQYKEVASLMDSMAGNITEGFAFHENAAAQIADELDKEGISVFEINVVEGGNGMLEVYMSVDKSSETHKIAYVLEEILETPMEYESNVQGALMRFVSRAKYTAEVAVKQICRDYSEISGDCVDNFTTEDYKQYVIISDGMGSGARAMTESRLTINLLKQFLLSGFGVRTAVDMINSALCLKLDYECFSTIDLLRIDLMTGVCEFYKIGGAESVVMHGASVETVFSVSLPIGMVSEIRVQGQAKRLGDGDVVVMMSDGVSGAGYSGSHTEWIKKEIQKPYPVIDDMAQSIIESAIRKSRDSVFDDMTVAAVRLVEN